MAKKSYIVFKDLRAFWDKKTDTIRLTSGDPDLSAQGWSLTLNRASKDEQILRDALTDAGVIPEENRSPGLPDPRKPNFGQQIARPGGTLMNKPTNTTRYPGEYTGHATGPTTPVFFSAPPQLTGVDAVKNAEEAIKKIDTPVNKNTLDWLRDNVHILEFLEDQRIRMRPVGTSPDSWLGLCPIHDEKVPSFRVNMKKNTFHCYGCGRSGDIITLVQAMEKTDFATAVTKLAVYKNLDLAALQADTAYQQRARESDVEERVAARREYEEAKGGYPVNEPLLKAGEAPDEAEAEESPEVAPAQDTGEGSYLGYTTGNARTPLVFDPFDQIKQNQAPGCFITGEPGTGKSFLTFKLAYDLTLRGVQTVYLDPKADAASLISLPGMELARLLDIREGFDGFLDPVRGIDKAGFRRSEQMELVLHTLNSLLDNDTMGLRRDQRQSLLARGIETIAQQPNPSLFRLLDYLQTKSDTEGELQETYTALYLNLKLIATLPFGRLLFGEYKGKDIPLSKSLTIITMLGLDLPAANKNPFDFSNSNRLAVSIMALLTSKMREYLIDVDKSAKKSIIIDEADTLLRSTLGKNIVVELGRMGRSLNTSIILVGQEPESFLDGPIRHMISTGFAFRTRGPERINNTLTVLSLAKNNYNRNVLRNARNGECMLLRPNGDVITVQIDATAQPQLTAAFNTNPDKRKK